MNEGFAIFGGSFDPIHLGHIQTAKNIQDMFHFKRMIFMPCGQGVFKGSLHASNIDRLAMLRLALKNLPDIEVDTREMHRTGPSYTILSIEELRKENLTNIPMTWIMGEDAFQSFDKWLRFEDILSLVNLIILARPQLKKEFSKSLKRIIKNHQTINPEDLKKFPCGKIFFYSQSQYAISSSQIRQEILQGILPSGLDPHVWEYIQIHHLYQSSLFPTPKS